jgi:putative methionine transporter, NhaC family (TC 2.A.35.1.-)
MTANPTEEPEADLRPFALPSPANPWALMPLVLFLTIFVGTGLSFAFQGIDYAFYQIQPTVAILPAIALALGLAKGPFAKRLEGFIDGVRDPNIILMCLIYLLAGAFSAVTKEIGSIEATVNWGLSLIPGDFLLPGLFIIATFMSTAMGTSMGVIATLAPLAFGIAQNTGLESPWCLGAVVSGAMFGDNLSLVSDTTIASVATQGANLKQKFLLNASFAVPAMLLTCLLFYLASSPDRAVTAQPYEWIKVAPYLLILILALTGLNVMIVLASGIMFAGLIGWWGSDSFTVLKLAQHIATGFASMQEILILSLLIGGLSYLTNKQGGFEYLIHLIEKLALKMQGHSNKQGGQQRFGEFAIAALASLADICTANNTVAIILSGPMAKRIAQRYHISSARSACIIDIFSCVFQGLLPYSAQILLASSIADISPLALMSKVIYCPLLGLVTAVFMVIKWPKRLRK